MAQMNVFEAPDLNFFNHFFFSLSKSDVSDYPDQISKLVKKHRDAHNPCSPSYKAVILKGGDQQSPA